MPKANVPFFDEKVDFTDPVGAGRSLLMMGAGAGLLFAALALGKWGLDQVQSTTGVGDSYSIPVAGD